MKDIKNRAFSFLRLLSEKISRSLRAKIILGVISILVVVTGFSTYYATITRIKFYLTKQEERAFDISASVMKGIEYPMLDGEMEDVQAILQKIGMLEGLEVVNLCDLTGTIRYSGHLDNIDKVNESEITMDALHKKSLAKGLESYKGKKVFSHAIPILNERPCFKCHGSERDFLGVLTVGIDWMPIEKRINILRNREITLAVISMVVIAFFLIRWLSKNITKPILKVTEFAEEVSLGNFDAKLDLGKKIRCKETIECNNPDCPAYQEDNVMCWYIDNTLCSGEPSGNFPEKLKQCSQCQVYYKYVGDEIVQLGDSLVHMLKNMKDMYGKISSFSKDLEQQVAKRTWELEQKTAEVEKANIQLKKLDELRSTFLANMSHELRTPLNSVLGYTDLLLDRVDGDITGEQENSLTKVHNNAKYLLELINDILDMSRIESGRVELDLRPVNLDEIIRETISTLEPLIGNKGLVIDMNFDEDLPQAYADPDRVRQIVTNLLGNAIKFTSKGRITITARASEIGVKGNRLAEFVEVCISDTGIGIREEDLGKLFDKFRQLDASATKPYKGVGLGLSICKGLIEAQNGDIWVKSKFGEGSSFCFSLPIKAKTGELMDKLSEQDDQAASTLEKPGIARKISDLKVLVVDDEPGQVELISKILKKEGCQITKAYDGEMAINSIKVSKPDLIILDLMMPKVTGFGVIEFLKAREDTREIPIIVITGKELTKKESKALNEKVEKVLKKGTLRMEVILEVIRNTLDKFHLR